MKDFCLVMLPGDGIGPEISEATGKVVEAFGTSECFPKTGKRNF